MSDERDQATVHAILTTLWRALGDDRPLPKARLEGHAGGLPSKFAVGPFAGAAVSVATAAIADLLGDARGFEVNLQHAATAFRSERYVSPIGWQLPPIWDPIAGDYRATDGWVRIHTNYAHHRDATLRALGVSAVREDVTRAVATRSSEDVEAAIVREGGAAAKLRTAAEWRAHVQGRAVADEPLFLTSTSPAPKRPRPISLAGARVLDLTRVIAGPVCTRVLAAYGADVLRIDPPGFDEVGALLPDTTAGKRRAALDLRAEAGRSAFLRLVADADLLVCGYRASALERLGLGIDALRNANPNLGIMLLDAYGWSGPWRERRGFDSLVQMTTGIADPGGNGQPVPLPAQALDHGAGYLLAAAAARALANDGATTTRISLARVAKFLVDLGPADVATVDLDPEPWREPAESAYGPLLRVRCPGRVDGTTPRWDIPAGPLGVDEARWR